jgi:hypothetical protein
MVDLLIVFDNFFPVGLNDLKSKVETFVGRDFINSFSGNMQFVYFCYTVKFIYETTIRR